MVNVKLWCRWFAGATWFMFYTAVWDLYRGWTEIWSSMRDPAMWAYLGYVVLRLAVLAFGVYLYWLILPG